MIVSITSVRLPFVDFVINHITCSGVWADGSQPPSEGVCDVEMDVDGILKWGVDIGEDLEPRPGMCLLVGRPLSTNEDGVVAVNIGGGVVLLEVEGAPLVFPREIRFTVDCENLRLSPVSL